MRRKAVMTIPVPKVPDVPDASSNGAISIPELRVPDELIENSHHESSVSMQSDSKSEVEPKKRARPDMVPKQRAKKYNKRTQPKLVTKCEHV